MANELSISYPGDSSTLYAIIRRKSDSYVWSVTASTFGAWANGSIADYGVALTNRGGDLYTANFPSAITAANYWVDYYIQAGGTEAITDTKLPQSDVFYWNGTAASSASSVTLSAYALATLDQVKQDLAVTDSDSDTAFTEYINQASALIERVCGIHFLARDYRHRVNGIRQRRINLPERPINTVTRIAYGAANAMSASFTGSAIRADMAVTETGIRLNSVSSTGTATSNHLLFATYGSVSAMVTAISAVTGWTATTITNVPTTDLNRTGGQNALAKTVFAEYPDLSDVGYIVDYQLGAVEISEFGGWIWNTGYGGNSQQNNAGFWDARMQRGFQSIIIEYNAGYSAVPDDVNALCRDLVRERHHDIEIGPGVNSITMGPFATQFARVAESTIRERLGHYMAAGAYIADAS